MDIVSNEMEFKYAVLTSVSYLTRMNAMYIWT